MKQTTRRRFLIAAGATIGASLLACGGFVTWGLRSPVVLPPAKLNCGKEQTMEGKILVAYASRAGSTAEVAEFIGKTLCEAGFTADVRNVKEVKDLKPYRAVVLGSAIRMGKPLAEATQFAKRNRDRLANLPVAYFMLGLGMKGENPEGRQQDLAAMAVLREVRPPVSEGLFAGVMNYAKLGKMWEFFLSKSADPGMAEGDFRDWEAISAWTHELAILL